MSNTTEDFNHRAVIFMRSYAKSAAYEQRMAEFCYARCIHTRDGRKRRGYLIQAAKHEKKAQEYVNRVLNDIREIA